MPEFKRYLRTLARNPVIRVFALILFVALMGGIAVAFLEERAGHQDFHSISEALWWAVVTMTTVGYGDITPQSGGSRILAVMIMFTGISLISFLTGSIASVAVARRLRSNQGLTAIKVKDHIIICGWHHKIESVLDAFLTAEDQVRSDQVLVLVNEEPEDAMQALKNQYGYTHIKYIRGDYTHEKILRQANLEYARAVVLLPTELPTGGASDEKTILACLTIKTINPKVQVVAYVHDQSSINHVKRANADNVVLSDNFGSFIIASHVLRPGIPQAAEELLDSKSTHHVIRVPIPQGLIGRTFKDLSEHNRQKSGWITIGIFKEEEQVGLSSLLSADTSELDAFIERKMREAGRTLDPGSRTSVMVNPPDDYVIEQGEGAIVIP